MTKPSPKSHRHQFKTDHGWTDHQLYLDCIERLAEQLVWSGKNIPNVPTWLDVVKIELHEVEAIVEDIKNGY